MPRLSRRGASVSSPTAKKSSGSTTQRFVRMWEFYLASSEMAFRESDMVVFQIQMAKRKGVVPQTRDYIGREEARLRGARSRLLRTAAPCRRIAQRTRDAETRRQARLRARPLLTLRR